MVRHNAENERIKHRYFQYLCEAKRYSSQTVDGIALSLTRFERHTKFQSFKRFHRQKAIAFKTYLAMERNQSTGKPLSKSTRLSTLNALKAFFFWLADQPGYRSLLNYSDSEYFNMSEKDTRAAKMNTSRSIPTIEQIRKVLDLMPDESDCQKRDRALVAFTILTGSRDGATASLKLKHIDIAKRKVIFDGREVATKFSKSFTTWFFPVGGDIEIIFIDWLSYLKQTQLFGPEDPLFPATKVVSKHNDGFQADGLSREHWQTASPIRDTFKKAFRCADIPYANPHSFRNTLTQMGEQLCRTPEEFKAWSQNIGHERVMTTLMSYGAVQADRQEEIIQRLNSIKLPNKKTTDLIEMLRDVINDPSLLA
ncbi:tyrosine-type recombinase/integrase [Hwanghaeella sp. LZ110]|uniref:tyrosine-type recombinase/integrase n=1 Tax=Hwanghaeella sp. LZ110 TaxID=3402810 RepID=UPI003B67F799